MIDLLSALITTGSKFVELRGLSIISFFLFTVMAWLLRAIIKEIKETKKVMLLIQSKIDEDLLASSKRLDESLRSQEKKLYKESSKLKLESDTKFATVEAKQSIARTNIAVVKKSLENLEGMTEKIFKIIVIRNERSP